MVNQQFLSFFLLLLAGVQPSSLGSPVDDNNSVEVSPREQGVSITCLSEALRHVRNMRFSYVPKDICGILDKYLLNDPEITFPSSPWYKKHMAKAEDQAHTLIKEQGTRDSSAILAALSRCREPLLLRNTIVCLLRRGIPLQKNSDPEGQLPLQSAVSSNDLEALTILLSLGANPHCEGKSCDTPLVLAAKYGCNDCIPPLLAYGAKINGSRNYFLDGIVDKTPLIAAIERYDPNTLNLLLKSGADPKKRVTAYSCTPLHTAVSLAKSNMVQALINAGADINSADSRGETPFYLAMITPHSDTVSQLLMYCHDTPANVPGGNGKTPMDLALNYGPCHTHLKMFAAHLQKEARRLDCWLTPEENSFITSTYTALDLSPGEVQKSFNVALDAVCEKVTAVIPPNERITCITLSGKEPRERFLVQSWCPRRPTTNTRGVDVNQRGPWDWTLLHIAANRKAWLLACWLLLQGADPHVKDCTGQIPFDYAQRMT